MPISPSAKDQFGKVLIDDDFFLFRPIHQYRTNANITILRTEMPLILDTGTTNNPPLSRVLAVLNQFNISPERIRYIIISHGHQDHFQNLPQFQRAFPKAETLCHKADLENIRNPYRLQSDRKEALKYCGMGKVNNVFSGALYRAYAWFFYRNHGKPYNIDYVINRETLIHLGKDSIKLIHTPNHSNGHLIILDNRKNLYLADMVPFTPWIEMSDSAIDSIIASTKRILQFDESQVKRAIHAHGDIRIPNHLQWEIHSWGDEKIRFQFFLETIQKTLEDIPNYVKTSPLTTEQLTKRIIPHYMHYSKWLARIFIPPAISWTLAYTLKLKREGKIHVIQKGHQWYWTN